MGPGQGRHPNDLKVPAGDLQWLAEDPLPENLPPRRTGREEVEAGHIPEGGQINALPEGIQSEMAKVPTQWPGPEARFDGGGQGKITRNRGHPGRWLQVV